VRLGDRVVPHSVERVEGTRRVSLAEEVVIVESQELVVS
jgi:hypothetical protein